MKIIIGLFTKYFLILMVIQGLIVAFVDYNSFKRGELLRTARKAKILGATFIAASIALFILRTIMQ